MTGKEKAAVGTTAKNINPERDKGSSVDLNGKKPVPVLSMKPFAGPATQENKEEIKTQFPEGFEKNVFIPTWENKPEEAEAILSYNGSPILTNQNTTGIIAAPGMGKSSLAEAVAASFLNPDADALGFAVNQNCTGILIIDNERTTHDVWNSFYRMCKRAKIPFGAAIKKNVTLAGLRAVPRLKERLATIEFLLTQKTYGLLILDGAGDLVTDSNDLLQAIECRIWLREQTSKHNISILTTIHPNPNTNKPRGHIGSEVHRECECVLLAKSMDGDVRVLTSDFEFGKNRNHAHVTGAYRWSDEAKMFVTADVDSIAEVREKAKSDRRRNEVERIYLKTIPPPKSKNYTELYSAVVEEEQCSEPTAKRRVREMVDFGFIKKYNDGLYRAV